jgi:pimeloyl-ACP methyl ester carboxylesterase
MKILRSALRTVLVGLLTAVVFLLSCQSSIIYHPNAYQKPLLWELNRLGGKQITVSTSQGKQTAFYLPPRKGSRSPEFLWFVFGGNGALALDYMDYTGRWDQRFAYVFVDYPGYGLCEGKPTPARIQESITAIAAALRHEIQWNEAEIQQRCGVLGHSLGCAAALIAADDLKLTRAVICAPFTTMTDMGRTLLGWPLCQLNYHRFDNIHHLTALNERSVRVRAFHGQDDEVIPVTMGRDLAKRFPQMIQFTEVPGARHNDVIMDAAESIGKAMFEISGLPPK